MHDKDSSGTIDMDECMEILFRRFGKDQVRVRAPAIHTCTPPASAAAPSHPRPPPARPSRPQLEEKTNEFFKHDTDGDNAISFAEFQKQMQAIRPKRREAGKAAGTKSTTSSTSITSLSGKGGRPTGGRK